MLARVHLGGGVSTLISRRWQALAGLLRAHDVSVVRAFQVASRPLYRASTQLATMGMLT